jgi:lysophospholipase L1-like esterase
MDLNALFNENEKPLDHLIDDGGFASIFRTFACIGDSLSSGEFERLLSDGTHGYYDFYEYSWGQYMARAMGSKCYNFSRGGMTAKEFCTRWAKENAAFDPEKVAQAYIIAMGANDVSSILRGDLEFGSVEDIDFENHENNKNTFVGYYAKIIQIYKEISPDAHFFLMTMPRGSSYDRSERAHLNDLHREMLIKLCSLFENTHLLDLRTYAPVYDEAFCKRFFLLGHMNPMGYILTAKMTLSYIDYIIRHNMESFKGAGFIGSKYRVQKF